MNKSDDKKGAKLKTSLKYGSNDGKSRAKSSVEVSNKTNKRSQSEKWCDLHQTHGHDTTECKVVSEQISKMRQIWETVCPASKFKSKYNVNTHHKKNVMSLVKEGIKQMINA
jgi:hypothetical protein